MTSFGIVFRSTALLTAVLSVLTAVPRCAQATARVVPTEFPTIADAIGASSPGDTILVAPGVHTEPDCLVLIDISLIGDGTRDEVVVEVPYFAVGEMTPDSVRVYVENIEFRQVGDISQFFCVHDNPFAEVRSNRFFQDGSFVVLGAGCTIEDNQVYFTDLSPLNIKLRTGITEGDHTGDLTIRNNVFRLVNGPGLSGSEAIPNADISHNTFVYPPWAPGGLTEQADFSPGPTNMTVSSNIFWGQSYACSQVEGTFRLIYNCFYPWNPIQCEPYFHPTNIEADPEFCDRTFGVDDYTLRSESPCVGTGEDGTNMGALGIGCSSVSVPVSMVEPTATTLAVAPNPASGDVTLTLRLDASRDVLVQVFDVTGRLRHAMPLGILSPGTHEVRWDARGSNGRALTPGVYFVRMGTSGGGATRVILGR